jgi:hypothetical protein
MVAVLDRLPVGVESSGGLDGGEPAFAAGGGRAVPEGILGDPGIQLSTKPADQAGRRALYSGALLEAQRFEHVKHSVLWRARVRIDG